MQFSCTDYDLFVTLTNLCTKLLIICKVYIDVTVHIHCRWYKIVIPWLSTCTGANPLAKARAYLHVKADHPWYSYFLTYIPGQKRNAAYKYQKYCALNEIYKFSSAIYVSLLFLPHIISIVSLSSVNPNQCTGCLIIFKFFTCTFILFILTHVINTEITSLISNLLENILKLSN